MVQRCRDEPTQRDQTVERQHYRGTEPWRTRNSFSFTETGESINETKIITSCGKGTAGFSIEGQNAQKDGVPPCRLATEAITTGSASLSWQLPFILPKTRIRLELGGAS